MKCIYCGQPCDDQHRICQDCVEQIRQKYDEEDIERLQFIREMRAARNSKEAR